MSKVRGGGGKSKGTHAVTVVFNPGQRRARGSINPNIEWMYFMDVFYMGYGHFERKHMLGKHKQKELMQLV